MAQPPMCEMRLHYAAGNFVEFVHGKTEAAMSRLSSLLSDVAWLLLLVCVLPVAIIVIGLPFAAIARLIHALVSRLL